MLTKKNYQQAVLFMIRLFKNKLLYNFRDLFILNSQLHRFLFYTAEHAIIYISSFTEQTMAT